MIFSNFKLLFVLFCVAHVFSLSESLASVESTYAFRDAKSESDYFSSIPVVLTATRLSQPVTVAPAAITVITRQMIEASGAQEIGDLLRLVPGFQVGYFNGISMSLSYHGFTGNYDRRLQVLIDGRSVYMPMLSTVEWLSLPLDISEVEKIEVVRGSNTPVYGANSFRGVINIITRKSFQDLGAKIETTIGSFNLSKLENAISHGQKRQTLDNLDSRKVIAQYANAFEQFDYRLTLGYQQDHGFDEVKDSKELSLAHFVFNYQLDSYNTLGLQLGTRIGDMDTFASGSADDPHRKKDIQSNYQSLTWNRSLGSDRAFELRFYHNYYEHDDEYILGKVSELLGEPPKEAVPEAIQPYFDDNIKQGIYFGVAERFDLELQYTFSPVSGLRVVSGGGARLDRMQSSHLLNRSKYITDKSVRAYTNLEWYAMRALVVNAGIMFENNQQTDLYYSPRLALNLILNDENVLRLALTRAFRAPSILENNVDLAVRLPNRQPLARIHYSAKNLNAEKLDAAEFGYLYHSQDQRISFDSKVFMEKFVTVFWKLKTIQLRVSPGCGIITLVQMSMVSKINCHYAPIGDYYLL